MSQNNDLTWKCVNGWPYSVSNEGHVRNDRTGHIKAYSVTNCGYAQVALFDNGKCKRFSVHRLVAEAFVPNAFNDAQVNHIDGNKLNNVANNLEWVSNSQNQKHKYDVLGYKKTTWNVEPAVAATRKKVVCIQTGKEYKSLAEAASEFGGRASALCSHLKGKTSSFSGCQWRYANE